MNTEELKNLPPAVLAIIDAAREALKFCERTLKGGSLDDAGAYNRLVINELKAALWALDTLREGEVEDPQPNVDALIVKFNAHEYRDRFSTPQPVRVLSDEEREIMHTLLNKHINEMEDEFLKDQDNRVLLSEIQEWNGLLAVLDSPVAALNEILKGGKK